MAKITTTEEFVKKAKSVHGAKYDYSKVEYKGRDIPVTIVCQKHGEFLVSPANFLRSKNGSCKECQKEKLRSDRQLTKDDFIKNQLKFMVRVILITM